MPSLWTLAALKWAGTGTSIQSEAGAASGKASPQTSPKWPPRKVVLSRSPWGPCPYSCCCLQVSPVFLPPLPVHPPHLTSLGVPQGRGSSPGGYTLFSKQV